MPRQSKITKEEVDLIVKKSETMLFIDIAKEFNYSISYISKIIKDPDKYRNKKSYQGQTKEAKIANKSYIATGLKCSACGIYFNKEHGYPVLCDCCYIPKYIKKYPNAVLAVNKIRD